MNNRTNRVVSFVLPFALVAGVSGISFMAGRKTAPQAHDHADILIKFADPKAAGELEQLRKAGKLTDWDFIPTFLEVSDQILKNGLPKDGKPIVAYVPVKKMDHPPKLHQPSRPNGQPNSSTANLRQAKLDQE